MSAASPGTELAGVTDVAVLAVEVALPDPETNGVGPVGPTDLLGVPVAGADVVWTGGGGVVPPPPADLTVSVSSTLLCPSSSSAQVASTGSTTGVPSLRNGVIRTVRPRNEIVAVPGWLKRKPGVTPAALTVIGPDSGTWASETVTGMVTTVTSCPSDTEAVAFAVPLTSVAAPRWSPLVTKVGTVAVRLRMMPGTFRPATAESGAFALITAVIGVGPYEDEHVKCNSRCTVPAAAGKAPATPTAPTDAITTRHAAARRPGFLGYAPAASVSDTALRLLST